MLAFRVQSNAFNRNECRSFLHVAIIDLVRKPVNEMEPAILKRTRLLFFSAEARARGLEACRVTHPSRLEGLKLQSQQQPVHSS